MKKNRKTGHISRAMQLLAGWGDEAEVMVCRLPQIRHVTMREFRKERGGMDGLTARMHPVGDGRVQLCEDGVPIAEVSEPLKVDAPVVRRFTRADFMETEDYEAGDGDVPEAVVAP